jgi:hypothetical protein
MTITAFTELTTITCSGCSGAYAISTVFMEEARRKGGFAQCWSCPYCKSERGFGESEKSKLESKIAALERSRAYLEQSRTEARQEAEHFRKSRDGIKGALVKQKKRIGKGACPCCNRFFPNLHRHMLSKHPEHATQPEAPQP